MDVTLERVQFKFASIIGELCSKPHILSQFAIWVDLRLAEYKLKGAISLDCSGDKPDPEWLMGMKHSDEFAQGYPSSEHHRSRSCEGRANNNRSVGETRDVSHLEHVNISNRLKAEPGFGDTSTIVIQADSDDDRPEVFPTGIRVNEPSAYNHARKRSRDREEDGLYSTVHQKLFKSEPSPVSQVSNQSLMSIIGGEDSTIEASPVTLEESQRDTDLDMAIQIQESHSMGDNSLFIPGRSSHASSTITQSHPETDISFNTLQSKSNIDRLKPGRCSAEGAQKSGMVELLNGTGVYLYPVILKRALELCSRGTHQGKLRDGQPSARYLLSVFFSREEIAKGTLSQTADQNEVLDPVIIQVITDFCLLNSDSKRSHIKQALYRKISSYRFKNKHKQRESLEKNPSKE